MRSTEKRTNAAGKHARWTAVKTGIVPNPNHEAGAKKRGAPRALPCFSSLPDEAFARQAQLVSSRHPEAAPVVLPFSASTLWRKIANGSFPRPTKLSGRVTAWRVGDVRRWLAEQEAKAEA